MGGASKILMLLSTPFPLLYPHPSSAATLRLTRHSRTALSAAFAHHHAYTRSAPLLRPKAPFRSQLHTQSAQREGHRDSPLGGSAPVPKGPASLGLLWPEWTKLVENLTAGGYYGRGSSVEVVATGDDDDSFAVLERMPDEFARAAEACLAFARDRPEALRLFAKKNIEVIVDRGSPSLFKNGSSSARRMRMFLNGDESNVLESERAQTVDVMRYVLSYAYDSLSASEGMKHKDAELVEASVRSLLAEFVNMSGTVQFSKFTEFTPRQPPVSHEQFSRPPGQIIEMKRGDWICPKCSFMNFARNSRCLECEEARPKRELTGGEWECPQCDFYNFGRNMSCLRCDCKRPGEIPLSTSLSKAISVDQILSGSTTDKSEFEQRLAANDEKGERWFSMLSQLGDKADTSSAAADEDFPETIALRKDVNRFVASTRKTPLERRLANSQSGVSSGSGSDKPSDSAISKSLDRILGRSSTSAAAGEADTRAGSRFNPSEYRQSIAKGDPGYVPFVPLPPDLFSKPQNSNNEVKQEYPASLKADAPRDSPTGSSTSLNESKNNNESSDASERWSKKVAGLENVTDLASAIPDEDFPEIMPTRRGENRFVVSKKKDRSLTSPQYNNESSDASERWSKKVAGLENVTDLASAIPDEDFPEIMPTRRGENRFVVSKKKDRSLTSPQYKRRLAMEQANKSDNVPFVPFPPGYFAKKDKQPEAAPHAAPNNEAVAQSSTPPENFQALPEKQENKTGTPNWASTGNISQQPGSRIFGQSQSYNTQFPGNNLNESRVDNIKESGNSELSQMSSSSNSTSATWGSTQEVSKSQSTSQSWNKVFSGKSLEGSAVTEPDPLDMSEEAKAARWFRRAAQIKNISELSEIPDEDFPEIMPMRKGVNRFVVSKRKTPLERRLTSPHYRRNLPIVSSEPEKDAS